MKKPRIFLFLILLITIAFRFYQIDTNPKSLYGDGLTAVYDAYSIYKTGHDQKGNFLPLVFSLGGGRPGGYVYATVPFAAIFGPTTLAAQMVSVLSGIGIVLILYLLGKKFISEGAGLAIAASAALNPWELSLSRGPFETHFALFLTLLGFYCFILGFKKKYFFLIFGLAFGLASQTYSTYRLTIPLFTALLLFMYPPLFHTKKRFNILNNLGYLKKPVFLLSLMVIIFSTILSVYLTISRGNEDRFSIINIFQNPDIRSSISQKVKNERLLNTLTPTVSYTLHSPQLELAGILAENYFQNFLPNFLFLHGDGQVRHNPAEMGGLYWIDALLLTIGIISLYKSKKQLLTLLVFWILIAPIATSLVEGPHALRSSFLLPPLLILVGAGLEKLWGLRSHIYAPVVLTVLCIIFFTQFVYFVDRFYFIAPQKNTHAWSYPAKEAFMLASRNQQNFDFVILSNDIDNMEFAYPVYAKLDPSLVIRQNQIPARIGEYKFFKYNNIYIGSLPNSRVMQFIKELPGSVLYIGADKEQKYLENYKIISGFDTKPDLIVTSKEGTPDLYLSH